MPLCLGLISREVKCDSVFVSGNWTPTVHLASQSGNKLNYDTNTDTFLPSISRQDETVIGSANGSMTLKESLKEGFEVGYKLSKKITKGNIQTTIPLSDEKQLGMPASASTFIS